MGKRVDFSARTVISPDANMDVDELGVPYYVAMKVTFKERVTSMNFHALTERVRRGASDLQGARSIIKSDGTVVMLDMYSKPQPMRLQLGWQVERYLEDGDTVLFNRQPSLRKKSIMAHKVRLMPGKTFRLNLSCTGAYNGDFDGDEMNLHCLQSYSAVVEAKQLMSVEANVLNAQNCKPVLELVQDTLIGAFLLTHEDQFLSRSEMMQLMMHIQYFPLDMPAPAILKPEAMWTGKQAFSMILPRITLSRKEVVIRNGYLLRGQMTKAMLGTSAGGILHVICKVLDNRKCIEFMSDCQRLVSAWLEDYGFSIGLDDCATTTQRSTEVQTVLTQYVSHVDRLEHMGRELNLSFEKREATASNMLAKMLNLTGGMVQKDMNPVKNSLMAMVQAGSKGNPINISQIMGCVGQQSVEGHRVFDKHNPEGRTLSCFPKGCTSAESKGFVKNSYFTGLTASEVYFHAMGGREGIVDTSVKTADTGYLQRRIMKGLESFSVQYDGTVRDSVGNLVDVVYGADNCDASLLEKVDLKFLTKPEMELKLCFSDPDGPEATEMCRLARECVESKLSVISPVLDTVAYLPVNVPLLLQQCAKEEPPVSLVEAQRMTRQLLDELEARGNTLYLRASIAFFLRSSVVHEKFSESGYLAFLEKVRDHIQRGVVDPGEMVGILAAESVGHPCTQLTLNTFHHAGIRQKNVTLGVPRIKELIDARRNIRSPSMSIYLVPPFNTNRSLVKVFKERLVYTTLADVVLSTSITLEPDIHDTEFQSDVDQFLIQIARHTIDPDSYPGCCRYVIRMELDKPGLMRRDISITDIRDLLRSFMGEGNHYILQTSEANMTQWIIRLRMSGLGDMHSQLGQHELQEFDKNMAHALVEHLGSNVKLCGIEGITAAYFDEHTYTHLDPVAETRKEWYIVTSGVNLRGLWNEPMIAWDRTVCNDLFEINEVLGIEAASVILFHEIKKVLCFDGTFISDRHILMICNAMTRQGSIMPLNRHGLNKLPTGPLVKSSFEMTSDVFFEAGAFSENNPLASISDNIMLGQRIPGGTGLCELVIAPEYLKSIREKRKNKTQQKRARVKIVRTYYSNFLANKSKVEEEDTLSYSPYSPSYTPYSPTYTPCSPSYTQASPLFQDTFEAAPAALDSNELWPEDSAMYKFALSNDIGFASSRYRPSSPQLVQPYKRYRPSTPLLQPRPEQRQDTPVSMTSERLHDVRTTLDSLAHPTQGHDEDLALYDAATGELQMDTLERLINAIGKCLEQ